MTSGIRILIHGIVQGVGFRPFVYRIAKKNRITGYVRNRRDSLVEIAAYGDNQSRQLFINELKDLTPPAAQIDRLEITTIDNPQIPTEFRILKSTSSSIARGSVIPADIALCSDCKKEIRDMQDRRYNYFFITCTNCGPRYTIINTTPYDRKNTTMNHFTPCSACQTEYINPGDRRFHAQTVACSLCGPAATLFDSQGTIVDTTSPITEAGKLLSEGSIVAVKGNGGYHLATSTLIDSPLQKLRSAKDRKQKPFAIMARDIDSAKSFTTLSDLEELTLLSPAHPITILEKSSNYYLSKLIAPGINNIGVMLPYSGLHLMLFNEVDDPAFVMTSANKPSEPIIKDDKEALRTLSDVVDYFLCHNRPIAQRCDDSVVKVVDNHQLYIRRSRGYAPKPILIDANGEVTVGLGAELNVTTCILADGKAFLSQHIGDIETYESLQFLEAATQHLLSLIRCTPERVACDLHPQFNTTLLAEQLSEQLQIPLFRIQHHHAHTAKLMAEHGIDEVVCITCDGFGMGLDRNAWGGEIFYSNQCEFKRLAHLEEHLMVGGDLATRYPLRMAASILQNNHEFQDWLSMQTNKFTHGKTEVQVIIKDAKDGKGISTSSCGRLLDAAAAILDICHERTYEGEPALKLESAAIGGRDILDFDPVIQSDILLTKPLIEWLFDSRRKYPLRDLAYTVHSYLAKGLALLAIREAERLNISHIGFTGGVAYNQLMIDTLTSIVSKHNLRLLLQEKIPCGDGGISLGQAFAASKQ